MPIINLDGVALHILLNIEAVETDVDGNTIPKVVGIIETIALAVVLVIHLVVVALHIPKAI